MAHLTVSTSKELLELCDRLQSAEWIAYDTEFIGEDEWAKGNCQIKNLKTGESVEYPMDECVQRLSSFVF
jgi:histidyl-tRNA synthetase